MIIKSFRAGTSAAVLKLVRTEMGGNAIVLKARELKNDVNGNKIEITACLENPTVGQSNSIFPNRTPKMIEEFNNDQQITNESNVPESKSSFKDAVEKETILSRLQELESRLLSITGKPSTVELKDETDGIDLFEKLKATLTDADTSPDFVEQFGDSLKEKYYDQIDMNHHPRELLVQQLSAMMTPSIEFSNRDKVLFIGPAGSGKSSAMGKIAAQIVMHSKKKVQLASLDNIKMGAFDEIHSYADLLDVDVCDTIEQAKRFDGVTLIDFPALGNDALKLNSLSDKVRGIDPKYCFLVVSSLIRSSDLSKILNRYQQFRPTHLIVSMMDLTDRLGSLISVARATGLKIAFISDTPGGVGTLSIPDPDKIARKILNTEVVSDAF